ncbi:endo-b1,4-mannanase 5C [Klebsiella pneumoniae]|uniref:mannan endo-1,4-beta-mannosidase n=1 Tax=Klebsiella pneumoniae TaxID=573 RepID=A0A377W1B5_KLEPN|nr:endo-b1,4-mannanase 5C [Klebsiella pneumoniae]
MVQTGAKAQRVYVLSVQQEFDKACGRETHILAPETADGMPRLNEKAMRVYDNMIAEADKQGLRLILPFIDHWWWWGGREQLAAFYHKKAEDFYRTDSKTFKAYLDVIRQVITRTNTVTGRAYYDEKAIMAWETGNELEDTNADFLHQTAAWIKKWAPHQLVVDGTYKKINPFALTDPNVDIVSNHYYTNADNNHPGQVTQDLRAVGGQKVYLVGEFGLLPADQLNAIMQSIVHSEVNGAQAAGGLIWGFRGHRHDGGFYWHKESTGHYSYHLPGVCQRRRSEPGAGGGRSGAHRRGADGRAADDGAAAEAGGAFAARDHLALRDQLDGRCGGTQLRCRTCRLTDRAVDGGGPGYLRCC